jgi:endonuclease/exonuclease/phosphatase family metal-dependent hydrolase
MRFLFSLFFALLPGLLSARAQPVKVMTFNLRYASNSKPNSWPERRPVMKECIAEADPDIFGTQEGLYHQLKDIEHDLGRYRWIGLGREGGSKGEFMAIFYKPEKFDPLEFDHFWLSDTPNVIGSSTWGNINRRMVTWVRFQEKNSKREFYLFNTHFDQAFQVAREKSAALLRQRIQGLKTDLPVIVTGDFNAVAGANKAYDILTEGGFLDDLWRSAKEHRGEIVATFHNFHGPVKGDKRIDWILGQRVEADWMQILTCSRNGQFPSDHFPVLAQIEFK